MLIDFKDVTKRYAPGAAPALDGVSLQVAKGEVVALLGPSGAGKSTLIRCVNGLVQPTSGQVVVEGKAVSALSGAALAEARERSGLIFQEFHLVDRHTALTNVLTGALGRYGLVRAAIGAWRSEDVLLARDLLARVGLEGHEGKLARDLSGGQRQRVAIARAMMQRPGILLGDEPVASLDPVTARSVMRLLVDLTREHGQTLVVSLHDLGVAREFCTRAVGLRAGRIIYDGAMADVTDKVLQSLYGEPGLKSLTDETYRTSAAVALERGCGSKS